MARSRNIKPGFFQNELLAELGPLAHLLFAGLWTLADKEGRLEDRPRRIKIQVLPYYDCNVDELMATLDAGGFITRYRVNGDNYIQINKWKNHQQPHYKEKDSVIPGIENSDISTDCATSDQRQANVGSTSVQYQVNTSAPVPLIPDSLNLIPDSLNLIPDSLETPLVPQAGPNEVFDHWRRVMNHPRAKFDEKRKKVVRRAIKDGYSVEDLKTAITGCSLTPHNMGENEQGQRYDSLELILRNGDQIDRFLRNATEPPRRREQPQPKGRIERSIESLLEHDEGRHERIIQHDQTGPGQDDGQTARLLTSRNRPPVRN